MSSFSGIPSGAKLGTKQIVFLTFAMTFILIIGGWIAYTVFPTPSNQGYAPKQPIPFSHRLHAGVNKIDCRYCHVAAAKSNHATIPAMNVCMNCHRAVKTDSPYIKQLTQMYNEGKPIEWIRVHELPDHVRFSHRPHILKGIQCETCHGNVKEMDVVFQKAPLTMGWCLSCHRGQNTPSYVRRSVNPDHPSGPVAPFNCATCHY